jgi:hypothetical protein
MRPKATTFFLFLFFSIVLHAQTKLDYDGYYHTISDSLNPFRFYLRFYEDGTVIGYTTAGNPKNLVSWFRKDHQSPSKGRYIMRDSTLSFTLKSQEGIVRYQGRLLKDNRLFLDVKSMINNYEGKEEYYFWPVPNLK